MAHNFKKQYGQNFLKTTRFAKELVQNLNLNENDFVIEIGPGDGMLTNEILKSGASILAIEVDYDLLPNLIKKFNDNTRFDIIHENILDVDFSNLKQLRDHSKIKVAGSLPYNISKIIIEKFLMFNTFNDQGIHIEKMGFIVQEEVAQKYNAEVPNATELSMLTKILSDVKKGKSIPASQFFPKPKVNGGILYFEPKQISLDMDQFNSMKKLIKIGFSSKKRKLIKNLSNSNKYTDSDLFEIFKRLQIDEQSRPSDIGHETWLKLFEEI